jgi:hypothetical protein
MLLIQVRCKALEVADIAFYRLANINQRNMREPEKQYFQERVNFLEKRPWVSLVDKLPGFLHFHVHQDIILYKRNNLREILVQFS